MRKPICDNATPVEMMCAAARADSESASRCDGQIWGACRAVARLCGMSNAKR